MDPLALEFTRNLVRKTARILAGAERAMRPGGIATPERLSAAVRAGLRHLAAHQGDVTAGLASAKAAGRVIHAAEPTPHRHKPPGAPDQTHPPAERPGEPRAVWHGSVPTSSPPGPAPDSIGHLANEAWHLVEAVGNLPFQHPRATAEVAGTEIIGLGPEDPAADVAAAAEIAVAEDAAMAAAKEAAERLAEAGAKEARESATTAAHETDIEIALYKAPAPMRDAVPELTKGFDAKSYPGDGPYLALDKHIAKRFQSHYRNGIQKFTISSEDFKKLSESGVIRSDTHYEPGKSIHAPANSLDQFNQAILRGSPNMYTPEPP